MLKQQINKLKCKSNNLNVNIKVEAIKRLKNIKNEELGKLYSQRKQLFQAQKEAENRVTNIPVQFKRGWIKKQRKKIHCRLKETLLHLHQLLKQKELMQTQAIDTWRNIKQTIDEFNILLSSQSENYKIGQSFNIYIYDKYISNTIIY